MRIWDSSFHFFYCMTKTYFILFFHIITFPLSAITLKGKIIDANTSQPLSFVNIGVKGTRYGTASNSTGNFVLNIPDKYKNGIIRFSCIGYEAKERSIKELLNQQIVKLTPSVIRLNEVTIMPDSTLRSFLTKAARKIPENYTSTSSRLSGFFRQTLRDFEDENNLRFIEMLIESYKTPYSDTRDGTVKVLNTRKYISGKDFFPSLFYGGPHVTHFQDIVKYRSKFLAGHQNYNYQLLGIKTFNERKVYEIEFTPAKKSGSTLAGRLYIDIENLAYIQIDIEYCPENLKYRTRLPALKNIKSVHKTESVVYDQYKGEYYFKATHGSEIFQDTDNNKYLVGFEYVTTHVATENVSNIPFKEQAHERYTPVLEAADYRKTDWKNYNILAIPETINLIDTIQGSRLLNNNTKNPKPFSQKILKVLTNLEYGFNIGWIDFHSPGGNYSLSIDDLNFSKIRDTKDGAMSFQSHLGYRLNNHSYIVYESAESLDKDFHLRQYYLGGRYYIPLKTTGKRILFNLQGGWSWQNMGISLGEQEPGQSFSFGGKKIKADKVNAFSGLRQIGLKAGVGLSIQLSHIVHFAVGTDYLFPLTEKDIAIIQEKSGFFLFRKKFFEELSNAAIDYHIDDGSPNKSGMMFDGWSFSAGMKIMF